ncbi:heavy metal-associated isoprenylated plant protein 41 [Canna indica]|uniref:Heavy metal-associated isoprenylated plant protein 41 n=1 Tax=Canna indica TaxID=4628 RepID=A0AAQ3L306_9LILI|nr:heavy metal-associated isoprenylated plant protein 41 [Canna indica]
MEKLGASMAGIRDIDEEEDEAVGVKWLSHYSSLHQILLVGEGDFSFSLALANAFGSASNIVATSLDSYDALLRKYHKAKLNLESLSKLGATTLHGVNAKTMKLHTDLKMRRFDRIIFNFPHAGFRGKEAHMHVINLHQSLVMGFFKNACHMLRPYGEVHVSHKTGDPFRKWNLEELASKCSLLLVECADFRKEDYPGYCNKRGEGTRCDMPFHLGECATYKFRLGEIKKRKKSSKEMESFKQNPDFVHGVPVPAPPLQAGVSTLQTTYLDCSRRIVCSSIVHALAAPTPNLVRRPGHDFIIDVQANPQTTCVLAPPRHEHPSYDEARVLQMVSSRRQGLHIDESPPMVWTAAGYLRHLWELHEISILRNAKFRRMLVTRHHEEDIRCRERDAIWRRMSLHS